MKNELYIPAKITVGQQERNDTFTKRLAYVVYKDEKGILRKEASWNSWRDKNIEPLEFDNQPVGGFIINKGVQRYGYYSSGRSVVRIFDPRGFEMEISVDNLMFLLMHSDVSKQDILEKCVYAWNGKDLVLLPINSQEYQESLRYTEKQFKKMTSKDLVVGNSYEHKKNSSLFVYIGRYNWYNHNFLEIKGKKEYIFYDTKNNKYAPLNLNALSRVISESNDYDVADLISIFNRTKNSSPFLKLEIAGKDIELEYGAMSAFKKLSDNKFLALRLQNHDISCFLEEKDKKINTVGKIVLTEYELVDNVGFKQVKEEQFCLNNQPVNKSLITEDIISTIKSFDKDFTQDVLKSSVESVKMSSPYNRNKYYDTDLINLDKLIENLKQKDYCSEVYFNLENGVRLKKKYIY